MLVTILIIAAAINLFLFYQDTNSQTTQSYSIIRLGDVKVTAESIASLSISIANGNIEDKENLDKQILEIENIIDAIKIGGTIREQTVEEIPTPLVPKYEKLSTSWEVYKNKVTHVETTSVFDPEATKAMNYLLQKNNELVLLTDEMNREFENLDRDYNRHKEIASELLEYSKGIGQQILLISIGEETDAKEKLKEEKLGFEIGIRKLLQISTSDLDVESIGEKYEELIPIPRENSNALRKIDPLWESMQTRITILEDRALLSPEFNIAKQEMSISKESLYEDIDIILQEWSAIITSQSSNEQTIIQIILIVDIIVFFLVLIVIRQSLSPLTSISQALSKVKEGVYGEKIEYEGTDEVGQLVNNFNIMSNTIKEEEAKKTDIAKDEFLAMITHELKTPLVPIQGYSDILLSEHLGKLTDKQKERIRIIKSSSDTLLAIISDLLDAQKLDLGQLRMKTENKNINESIIKSIDALKLEAESNNIEIVSNSKDVIINHDPERISQVITNLMKNSIIAIKPNPGKIEITVEDLPTEIKISVKDNGVGIAIDKQANLFKKFYQVDATLTREKGGSGLGLAICKGIINNHYGRIWVESVQNQGATFSFTIPKEISKSKTPLNSA
ncbi:sensor histidine kinase [Nitrosopumilus sp.]|uniref:sensor histidine kinase n=1 Tax=Nitrosopumilus sp. TaxID=2024843 RepID=UPI0034A04227